MADILDPTEGVTTPPDRIAEWVGPTCLMCGGDGLDRGYRAVSEPGPEGIVEVVRDVRNGLPCRACNGHGRDAI